MSTSNVDWLRWTTIAVFVVAIAMAVVIAWDRLGGTSADPHIFASVVYDPAETMPDFTLTAQDGTPFTLSEQRGEVVALYFGYTHCPDVCPLTLSNLARVRNGLPEDLRDDLQVVMVTVDPTRDTVEVMADYVPVFDASFIGISGTPAEVERVLGSWRIPVELGEPDAAGNYAVGHPAYTLILDREGRRLLKMNQIITFEQMAADLRAVLEQS